MPRTPHARPRAGRSAASPCRCCYGSPHAGPCCPGWLHAEESRSGPGIERCDECATHGPVRFASDSDAAIAHAAACDCGLEVALREPEVYEHLRSLSFRPAAIDLETTLARNDAPVPGVSDEVELAAVAEWHGRGLAIFGRLEDSDGHGRRTPASGAFSGTNEEPVYVRALRGTGRVARFESLGALLRALGCAP